MAAALSGGGHAAVYQALAQAVARFARDGTVAPLAQALGRQQALLDEELFPALFEAMAGSDAVCIRDMQQRCGAMAAALQSRLAQRPAGAGAPPDPAALAGHGAEYLAYLADEVLPMAQRLLP